MPFVSLNIVILTAVQLLFLKAIITSKSVNDPFMIHSREESFFLWHLCFHLELSVYVLKVCFPRPLSTEQEPGIEFVHVDHCDEWREVISVGSPLAPLKTDVARCLI